MHKHIQTLLLMTLVAAGCQNTEPAYDATGVFEADEVIISAEVSGTLLSFHAEEGQHLNKGDRVGYIDSAQLHLTRLQLRENQKAVLAGRPDTRTQLESTKKEIDNAWVEKRRIENLVKGDVATQKQLDDVNSRLAVLEARLAAQQSSLNITTSTLNEQASAIRMQLSIVEDQIRRCQLINPLEGTVLARYALANEVTAPGKALYKIATLDTLTLRAYLSGNQLPAIKLGQPVTVLVDAAEGKYNEYQGTITWISEKAEFTPKTIQTKDERANLVYAIKISVKNDGYLKLGMYGEVVLNPIKK